MDIDEAIKHCEEVAERLEREGRTEGACDGGCRCAADHRWLAERLRELKELRKLAARMMKLWNIALCKTDDANI